MGNKLTRPFLIFLILAITVACFLVFRPFLTEILVAAILVSILYRPYEKLVLFLGNRRNLAALIMCLSAVVLIILPLTEIIILAGKNSVSAYQATVQFFESHQDNIKDNYLSKLGLLGFNDDSLKEFVIDIFKRSSDWMVSGATIVIKGATNFFVSLFLIIFTMFFFFVDGKRMLTKLMYWSPLPNQHDVRIFQKFRDVSRTTILSTFVTAAAQGLVGGIGFLIVGIPAFLPGVLIGVTSLLPYIGSMLIYIPAGAYLLLVGEIWKGIFILAWGAFVIGNVDNIIRAYMIKAKAHVNPVFVLFSIFGGITIFGFWGVVIGPLIVSLAVTIMHIYEVEYCQELKGQDPCAEPLKEPAKKINK